MSELKQISDFPNVSIEDQISLTIANAMNPNEVEFILESIPSVTWWKAIELHINNGSIITNQSETQDNDHGPHSFSVVANNLVGARLTLAKAKTFGIHTGMYDLENLSSYQGRSLQFLWQRDDDRDGPVAGFFRDLGNGINTAADAVAEAIETGVETLAEIISTTIEVIATVLANINDAIGNLFGGIPLIGGVIRGVFHWIGTILSAALDFLATVIKATLDSIANVIAGLIRISFGAIGGVLAWDGRLFVKGLSGVMAGLAGGAIVTLLKAIAFVQSLFGMQFGERPLNEEESTLVWRVYRSSLAIYNIRIIEGFVGFLGIGSPIWVCGNRIYARSGLNLSTLVHECCHVWQYQHRGSRSIGDELVLKNSDSNWAYDWEAELMSRGHFRWQDFNLEAQAQFLQNVFEAGHKVPPDNIPGEFFEDDPVGENVLFEWPHPNTTEVPNYTAFARESVAYVRSAPWFVARP